MQRDFNNRDFEQFVKQNADQYRMFPSENVWQGINNALHTRRRWYGLGLALLLLMTGTAVTLVMVSTPANKQVSKNIISELAPASQDNDGHTTEHTPITTKPVPANPEFDGIVDNSTASLNSVLLNRQDAIFPALPISNERTIAQDMAEPLAFLTQPNIVSIESPAPISNSKVTTTSIYPPLSSLATSIPGLPEMGITPVEVTIPGSDKKVVTEDVAKTELPVERDLYPMTIESVVNSYRPKIHGKRFTMQFYLAPNISYRKLSENKKFLQSAANNGSVPVYAAYSDINNYVSHKPDMGLELGLTGKYALSNSLRLKAGFQFNVSRYDIKAAYDQHREDATIALDGGNWGANQTITRQTNYRNFSGNNPSNWLKNLYYSVSIPLGAEIIFDSKAKTHFGIAATFQPTYIIKDRAYLISTDYKNYVEVPSLVRKFNMNTSFETFIAYSTGNINWQVGPQVRYQIQSSFEKKYPFKENLFDFGLKVGIQLNR